jgi:hypothetical protein
MARYYFNVCCEAYETTDVVGEHCADDLEALSLALRRASEIVQRRPLGDEPAHRGWIEVEDEQSRRVLTLPLVAAAY